MAGYSDTRKMIIDALMGRPEGTQIQPEDHQAFALQIIDYIRSVELVAGNATPIGFADADTVPIQPYNGQAVYLSSVSGSNTVTFTNFIDQNGNAISVTSTANVIKLITLLWNGQYWSSQVTSVNAVRDTTDGYLFMGVATPTTNPGTPNQKVFYLASPGTYPNFSSFVVNTNEIGIFRYDTEWIFESLPLNSVRYDVPQNLNDQQKRQAQENIDAVPKSVIDGGDTIEETKHEESEFTSSIVFFRGSQGNNGFVDGFKSEIFAIPNNFFKIVANCFANNQYYAGITFLRGGTYAEANWIADYGQVSGAPTQSNSEVEILASDLPEGTTHIVVAGKADGTLGCSVFTSSHYRGIEKRLSDVENKFNEDYLITTKSLNEEINEDITTSLIKTYGSDSFTSNNAIEPSGNVTNDNTLNTTTFLPIPNGITKIEAFCLGNNVYYNGVSFYSNANIVYISNDYISGYPRQQGSNSFLVTIPAENIPIGAKFIRVTTRAAQKSESYVKFYYNEVVKSIKSVAESFNGAKKNHAIIGKKSSLTGNDNITVTTPHTCSGYSICVRFDVGDSLNGEVILEGIGYFTTNIPCIKIDGNKIYVREGSGDSDPNIQGGGGSSSFTEYVHGLQLKHNVVLSIVRDRAKGYVSKISLSSEGQTYEIGGGAVFKSVGQNLMKLSVSEASVSNAMLSFSLSEKKVWIFGDSFLDFLIRYCTDGVSDTISKNVLIDGYPGRRSQQAYDSLVHSLEISSPKILVWALAGNDKCSMTEVSPSWMYYYEQVKILCEKNGVELVLYVAENCPNSTASPFPSNVYKNTKRNEFIKQESGLRYVDLYSALIKDDKTAEWYEGMLFTDGVHPSALGAKVIWQEYIASVPEMIS